MATEFQLSRHTKIFIYYVLQETRPINIVSGQDNFVGHEYLRLDSDPVAKSQALNISSI